MSEDLKEKKEMFGKLLIPLIAILVIILSQLFLSTNITLIITLIVLIIVGFNFFFKNP